MSETMIKIEHVSKEYRLGAIGGTTLREDLQRLSAKIRKKDDPTLRIGMNSGDYNKRFLALDDVSFEVKRGEAVGIIGHNGAGKSTLLKLLSRVTAPTKGTISFNGRIASMLEVGTGFHPELTGRENVYMNGAILGMTRAEIDKKFDEIVAFAEMEKFIDTPVKRYSSGMYVKLAFAVAAHLDSEIMVMDEVLAVGDMKFQQKCLGKMSDAANTDGRTVLYVSHNMNTIRQLCSRCIVLDHGQVIFEGDTESAIAVYLDNGADDLPAVIDFMHCVHTHKTESRSTLCKFVINDRNQAIYERTERMYAELTIDQSTKDRNLCFRAMIYSQDETVVGMTSSTVGNISSKSGVKCLNIDIDISQLAPGDYYLKFALYDVNDFGTSVNLDVIDKAISFRIVEKNSINNMEWHSRWWGHISFPNIQIEEI